MKKLYFVLLLLIIPFSLVKAQDNRETLTDLKKIYESLEYNTIAFDDLKQKWIINDPLFIREIFNRFVVRDALRLNEAKVDIETVKKLTQQIYDGVVVIDLRKRYYDSEVELFAFINVDEIGKEEPKYLFDPIIDGFYLREIIGGALYERVKVEGYFLSDITKQIYDVKPGYFFDVKLNLLEPEVMFWNTTSDYRNKYLLSLFGMWGNDRIFIPGWYSKEYVAGLKLTYYNTISQNPKNFTYSVSVGASLPSGRPFVGDKTYKPLFISGKSLYFNIIGDPLKFVFDDFEDFQVMLEVKYTMDDYAKKDYGITDSLDFYSNRTYFNIEAKKRNLFNLFDFGQFEIGLGVSNPDINWYRITKRNAKVIDLEAGKKEWTDKFNHHVYLDLGAVRTGGLIQHSTNFIISHNLKDGGYFGLKTQVMLSENFGFDVRIFSMYGTEKKKMAPWREDSYLVFSPIIRINY